MHMRAELLMAVALGCAWQAWGQDNTTTPAEKPSAKEMFLNPRQMAYGAQDEAPAAKPKVKQNVNRNVRPAKPKPAEVVTGDKNETAQPAVVAVPGKVSSVQQSDDPPAQIIRAAYSNVPLGLRYRVQKKTSDRTKDVAADTEFHSGDRIQLTLEVNDTGYLYIISQGTSGTWTAMFPSPEIEDGDNRVQRGRVYTVPPRHVFTFSGKPGVERLFVIFSRQPVQEIDSLIYSLKDGRRTPAAASGEQRPAAGSLMADARFEDKQIAQLRATYSRDLIIEKGDQEPAPQEANPPQEKQVDNSVYVVNPNGSADSRVVADIPLIHK